MPGCRIGICNMHTPTGQSHCQVSWGIEEYDLVLKSLFQWAYWNAFFLVSEFLKVRTHLSYVGCMWNWSGPVFSVHGGLPFGFETDHGPGGTTAVWHTGRALSPFGYVHIRSRSMVPPDQCHFLRSNTQTDPSDALAPTLSPVAFQQTSKMPPVPR